MTHAEKRGGAKADGPAGAGHLPRRPSPLALLAIGGVLWLAALGGSAETPQQADAKGLKLVLAQRWDQALAHYEQAALAYPRYAPIQRNLSNVYVVKKQIGRAIETLQRAAVLEPSHEGTWKLMRELMLSAGRAGEWVGRAAQWNRSTRSDAALRALIGAHWRTGNRSQALALVRSRAPLRSLVPEKPFPPPSASLRRLVMLVTLDTFRNDLIDPIVTPALDRLARECARFTDCTAVAPITLPAHASIMTGMYPNRAGVRDNSIYRLAPEAVTLAEVFERAGWATGAFVSAYILDRRFGLDQGFAVYGDRFKPSEAGGRFPESRRAEETLAEAAAWLSTVKGDRAFLWVHLYDTHAPYDPPFPFDEAWAERPYRGEAAYLDHALGRFLDGLRGSPLWNDAATVLVAGDHGESLGEHGEATHGFLLYQSTLHVPFLFRWQGWRGVGEKNAVPVSQVDIFPTLQAICGTTPSRSDGVSLWKWPLPDRVLYSETQIPLPFHWSDLYRARRGRLAFTGPPAGRTFDLGADPHEALPLAKPPADLAAALDGYKRHGRGIESAPAALDEEAMARLRSLGYAHVGGAAPAAEQGELPDPQGKMGALTLYQRALEAEEKGDLKRLALHARELAQAEADNAAMLSFAAEWLNRAGDSEAAAKLVEQALALDPRFAQGLFYRGYLREARGDLRDAAGDYAAALKEQPGHFLARYNLSRIYLMKGEWSRAEAEMKQILERLPNHAYTLNNLAYLAMKRDQDCGRALELAEKANGLKPSDAVLKESLESIRKVCRKN